MPSQETFGYVVPNSAVLQSDGSEFQRTHRQMEVDDGEVSALKSELKIDDGEQ